MITVTGSPLPAQVCYHGPAPNPGVAMGYIEKHLAGGEVLVTRGRIHWMIFYTPLLYALAGVFFSLDGMGAIIRFLGLGNLNRNLGFTNLVALLEKLTGLEAQVLVGISFFIIAAGVLYVRIVRFCTTEIGLTDRRVILKVGWLRTDAVDVVLDRVEAIYVQQSILGRMLNYGSVSFSVGDSGSNFAWLADPFAFRKAVQARIDSAEGDAKPEKGETPIPEHEV